MRRSVLRKESHEAHHLRLLEALERVRVICWPWSNAIALQETRAEMTQYHIINNWLWLGTVSTLDEAATPRVCRPALTMMATKFSAGLFCLVNMTLLNCVRRMARHPVNLAEQQFSLALQQS